MKAKSFEEMHQDFEAVCAWFESKGITVAPKRLGVYRRAMKRLAAAARAGELEALKPEFSRFAELLLDIQTLLQVYSGLVLPKASIPLTKLKELASGCALISEETEKNQRARNTSFELEVAAILNEKSPVNLETSNFLADLSIDICSSRIVIECKRPLSGLCSAAMDGFGQLRRRYSCNSDRGMLFISCNRIVNATDFLIFAEDQVQLNSLCSTAVDQFIQRWSHEIPGPKHSQTIAAVLHFRYLAFLLTGQLWTHQTFAFLPMSWGIGPEDRQIIQVVSKYFQGN